MTLEERIDRVARAYVDFRFQGVRDYDRIDESARAYFRKIAAEWLEKGFPELFGEPPTGEIVPR